MQGKFPYLGTASGWGDRPEGAVTSTPGSPAVVGRSLYTICFKKGKKKRMLISQDPKQLKSDLMTKTVVCKQRGTPKADKKPSLSFQSKTLTMDDFDNDRPRAH
jgi:hypothetical protein